MKKYSFIISGNQLLIINKTYKNIIHTKQTNHKLTQRDCRHTYDITQLQALGYIVEQELVWGCMK